MANFLKLLDRAGLTIINLFALATLPLAAVVLATNTI